MNEVIYAAGAVNAEPRAALTKAAVTLILTGWQDDIFTTAAEPGLLAMVGPYDVIGAVGSGTPPVFGRYRNCSAQTRCLGCERACEDELALVELAERRRRPLLLVVSGTRGGLPSWLRVIAVAPGHSWSGKIFTPALHRGTRGLILACTDGWGSLVTSEQGLRAAHPQTIPAKIAASDRAIATFSLAIPHSVCCELAVHEQAASRLSVVA
jgi:hypothetical protein